ncbi:MAG: (4Fe-4S)-binding protein [Peptoniphilus sp.]|nr:(4Fe-4S)-binding protein [Peptoniphilus sp.]
MSENVKVYENDKVKVFWKPDICVHSGNCVMGNPKVFNPERKPWIDLSQADAEEIKRVIDTCPSGALSYESK